MKNVLVAQRLFFKVGILGAIISLPQIFISVERFYQSYLLSYLFWLEITLGSIAMLMVYFLTNGRYGYVTRTILFAAQKTIYLMAILFVPLLLGIEYVYPWAKSSLFDAQQYSHKLQYFNGSFFIIRSICYLFTWAILVFLIDYFFHMDEEKNQKNIRRMSAGFLVYFALSVSFASFDWQMSLEPFWSSSIYGLLFLEGAAFGAWAFTLLILRLSINEPDNDIDYKTSLDLANVLLTLVMLWAYLSFMQYLIIWSGDLPEEIGFFKKRMTHGWQYVMAALFAFLFAAPFFTLLFRQLKRRKLVIIIIALLILIFRLIERYFMIMPSFHSSPSLSYVDISLVVGVGGLWLSVFFRNLTAGSQVSLKRPKIAGKQNHA